MNITGTYVDLNDWQLRIDSQIKCLVLIAFSRENLLSQTERGTGYLS